MSRLKSAAQEGKSQAHHWSSVAQSAQEELETTKSLASNAAAKYEAALNRSKRDVDELTVRLESALAKETANSTAVRNQFDRVSEQVRLLKQENERLRSQLLERSVAAAAVASSSSAYDDPLPPSSPYATLAPLSSSRLESVRRRYATPGGSQVSVIRLLEDCAELQGRVEMLTRENAQLAEDMLSMSKSHDARARQNLMLMEDNRRMATQIELMQAQLSDYQASSLLRRTVPGPSSRAGGGAPRESLAAATRPAWQTRSTTSLAALAAASRPVSATGGGRASAGLRTSFTGGPSDLNFATDSLRASAAGALRAALDLRASLRSPY